MWALVPVKAPARSKQRLASVLVPAERAELACLMLADLLDLLEGLGQITRIHVLTLDEAVAERVRARGHAVVAENPTLDLNRNLTAAARRFAPGVEQLLVVPADLPAVTNPDMAALFAAHQGGVTLVPATVDGGTNAVLAEPPDALPFHFGAQSLVRHRQAVESAAVTLTIFQHERLGRDMDRPEDLAWFLTQPSDTRTSTFLTRIGVASRLGPLLRDSA